MKNWNFELVVGYAFDDAVPIGHADVSLVETFAEDFGAKPAIGLQLAQVAEQAAEGVVGRGAGTIDRGLSGGIVAICGFGDSRAMEAPGVAHDSRGEHFFYRPTGLRSFQKALESLVYCRVSSGGTQFFGWRRGPNVR